MRLEDFSINFALGFVGDQIQTHADNEYKRQLERLLRFAHDAGNERRDGVRLIDWYEQRYRREAELRAREKEESHAQTG